MLVPLSWLKEYVDIDVSPEVLEEKLFSCGFEVEEKYQVGKDIDKVVVEYVCVHTKVIAKLIHGVDVHPKAGQEIWSCRQCPEAHVQFCCHFCLR